jgi:hypothetical protein
MFLNKDEVHELTGYKYLAKQILWLNSHGYRYEINKNGHPKILKSFVETRLGELTARYSRKNKPQLNLHGLNKI